MSGPTVVGRRFGAVLLVLARALRVGCACRRGRGGRSRSWCTVARLVAIRPGGWVLRCVFGWRCGHDVGAHSLSPAGISAGLA